MSRKLKPAKNSKLPKLPENSFEPVEKGGWPPISTWINPPSLGSNGLHWIEFPGEREKHLLNLHLRELLALLDTSHCSVCGSLSWTCWSWGCSISWATLEECFQKESLWFVATLSTCFCWIEGVWPKLWWLQYPSVHPLNILWRIWILQYEILPCITF